MSFQHISSFMLNRALLINMKIPTIVGIFIFISRELFMVSYFSKKEFAIVSDFRFIS